MRYSPTPYAHASEMSRLNLAGGTHWVKTPTAARLDEVIDSVRDRA